MGEVREMLPLFVRAGLGAIPGVSRLPVVGGRRSDELPATRLEKNDVSFPAGKVADYVRVCEFGLSNTVPVTYPHVLAFPLQLSLMTDPSFPFPAMGLVHIYNRITQHRPIQLTETVSLRVWAAELEPHPRGQQFSLHSEVRAGDELVWEEISTNLRRGGGSDEVQPKEVPPAAELPATATWKLPGDLGRRYGSVSGDLNPIHIHPLSARLFGFPSAIAHGMWTKARCLAALEPRLPAAYTVEVAFRKPILLPATVQFASDGASAFGVRDAGKGTAHLDGLIS